MILDIPHLAFLEILTILTSALSAAIGTVGGVVLLGGMNAMLPFQIAVPLHGTVLFASNGTRALSLRRNISWRLVLPFAAGVLPALPVSYLALKALPHPEIFSVGVIALLLYAALRPAALPGLHLPRWSFVLVGFAATVLGTLLGAIGPIVATFFIRKDMNKEATVATQACCQILVQVAKIPVFAATGFSFAEHIWLIGALVFCTIIGSQIGIHFLNRMRPQQFMSLVRVAMILIALQMGYTSVEGFFAA